MWWPFERRATIFEGVEPLLVSIIMGLDIEHEELFP